MAVRSSLLLADLVGVGADAGAVAEGKKCWRRWLASGEAEWRWVVGCVDRGWLRVQGKKETVEVWVVFGRGQGE
ncbi:hypothetical protein BDE02_03G008100 [Populus trichocarpa]|nr:hypothetical protein BDE02_03G008100 [Populus trichocarpa]